MLCGALQKKDYKRHVGPLVLSAVISVLPIVYTMRTSALLCAAFAAISSAGLVKRDTFTDGQPIDPTTGKGAPLLGMYNNPHLYFSSNS